MKVTKGYLKGRVIVCPKKDIRPLMSILREYVFQIMENLLGDFSGLTVLDVFSGSASFSIEAISQGFESAVAVEKDAGKRNIILSNIKMTDGKVQVYFMPSEKFIVLKKSKPFDCIFLDPPFDYKHKNDLLKKLLLSDKIKDGTIIGIHHPKEDVINEIFTSDSTSNNFSFEILSSKNFGRSVIKFFKAISKETSNETHDEN